MSDYTLCTHPGCDRVITKTAAWCVYHHGWHDALDMTRAALLAIEEQQPYPGKGEPPR